ncbi:MAG: flagellar FlbD family protein [Bacillota bacterium]
MILVTRINGEEFYINPDAIEFMEETPDTVISMASGRKVVVAERALDIKHRIIVFRRRYLRQGPRVISSK